MKIDALLNPAPARKVSKLQRRRSLKRSHRRRSLLDLDQDAAMAKRAKTYDSKDAPRFQKGKPMGEVRFAPHQADTAELRRQHQRFHVFPSSKMIDYPRHIPYSSAKKDFYNKTGRESFEVFEYAFRFDKDAADGNGLDDHKKGYEWIVRFDYNIGLVRVTPFFKALGLAKTAPAKAIMESPGLMDICHSITGGSLSAQGYWMPYKAAKALAATFCWPMRYALTPVFGADFVDLCLHPEDPAYSRHTIDTSIIKTCAAEIKAWKTHEQQRAGRGGRAKKPVVRESTSSSEAEPEPEQERTPPQPRPLRPRPQTLKSVEDTDGSSSESDSMGDLKLSTALGAGVTTPVRPAKRTGWNAINHTATPQPGEAGTSSSLSSVASSPVPSSTSTGSPSTKRTFTTLTESDSSSSESSPTTLPKRNNAKRVRPYVYALPLQKASKRFGADEVRAAHTLMNMKYSHR